MKIDNTLDRVEHIIYDDKGTALCSGCGTVIDTDNWNYCPVCGARLVGDVKVWVDAKTAAPENYWGVSTIRDAISTVEFVSYYEPFNPASIITELSIPGIKDILPLLEWIAQRRLVFKLTIHDEMPDIEVISFIEDQGWKYTVKDTPYERADS